MNQQFTRLYGGHRNRVFKTNGFVKVIWQNGFQRKRQIREGVLLENFVAVHTNIKARMLVDKSKPFQEENGELVTYFHYVDGEIRYPWNLDEIASAAKLLTKLHRAMNPSMSSQQLAINNYRLHLDFARGNILFKPATSNAIGVIDFETITKGPVEQELGRTMSFLLVDTPLPFSFYHARHASLVMRAGPLTLESRMDSFLTNYDLPFRKDEVAKWTIRYLRAEDYGTLNGTRNRVLQWLKKLNNQ